MKTKTGAAFIAETLKGYDITHVFFMEATMRKSLIEMEAQGIKRILAHSEKAAAYMADGYAQMSRKIGVCLSQSVGSANLAAGLQNAYLGGSPVIAITGRRPPLEAYRNGYQEVAHDPLFDAITKFHANIVDVEQMPLVFRQAIHAAMSGQPGPVHIDLAGIAGQIESDEGNLQVVIDTAYRQFPTNRVAPTEKDIQRAVEALQASEQPVIVAGGGVKKSLAEPELLDFAEKLSIPVATSNNGKGAILDTHPLSAGVVGTYSRVCANRAVAEADLVIFIGSRTCNITTCDWTIPSQKTKIIQIDIEPSELGRNFPHTIGLCGDAKATLPLFLNATTNRDFVKKEWIQHVQQLVKEWRDEYEPLFSSNESPARPERLCRELTEMLPTNGILVADTGFASVWTGVMVDLTSKEQDYFRAAGSLGWAFPASLGVKCAATDRPVICFTGDGGFWYHLSELETAARWEINTVTVINNNHGFGQCWPEIDDAYGGAAGKREDLYRFQEVSFAKIAEDMNCYGVKVERSEDIAPAINKAFDSNLPAVVEVITDIKHVAPEQAAAH